MHQGIPPQFARVIVHGRVRLVPVSGNRVFVARQRTGEVFGHTASLTVTPFEIIWSGVKGVGQAIANSPEGQGFAYGYYQGQRNKSVFMTGRAIRAAKDETEIRQQAQHLPGVTAEQALNLPVSVLARMLADASIEDRYVDEESYVAEYPQVFVAEQEENPAAEFAVPQQHAMA